MIAPDESERRSDDTSHADSEPETEASSAGEPPPSSDVASDSPDDKEEPSGEGEPSGGADDDLPEWEPLTPELVEDEAIRGDFMLRWTVVLLAFLLGCAAIAETPTLVHIKTGQSLMHNGWLPPTTDVFSYTAADRNWVNVSWLFDLGVAAIHSAGESMGFIGGDVAVWFVKAVLAALAFGLIVHIGRPGVSTWWGSICAALALLVCYPQFSAEPQLITLLGLSLTLWVICRWQESNSAKQLWVLVPIFLLWSNLDGRMFLGLALLLLYALGDFVGQLVGRGSFSDEKDRKTFWAVLVGCVLASLANPFGWDSLLAPLSLYGIEYPAMRMYESSPSTVYELQFFPIMGSAFWSHLNHHALAGLLLIAFAGTTLYLNRSRLKVSHIFVLAGFVVLAAVCSHELAAAAIVAGYIATLNAQDWYRDNFRQTYSIEINELLFSRGGRAATVITLFAIAFFAISGRIGSLHSRRIAPGYSYELTEDINGLREQVADSFDNRPFNFVLPQGDLLIWVGQRVFVDSRVTLFSGTGDQDLLELHKRTRRALRRQAEQPSDSDRQPTWKVTFDQFNVTHVLPRLSGRNPDYTTHLDLLASAENWELTRLGPAASSFYRKDLDDPKLKQYLSKRHLNLEKDAFQGKLVELDGRVDWARERSFYQKYLSIPGDEVPNPIQDAKHLVLQLQLGSEGESPMSSGVAAALAHLAIRKANEGLSIDPQNVAGFRVLGTVYRYLFRLENEIARSGGGAPAGQRRYLQCVGALAQALRIAPDDERSLLQLIDVYLHFEKFDLALDALERFDRLSNRHGRASNSTDDTDDPYIDTKVNLNINVDRVEGQIRQALDQNANRLDVAKGVYRAGCPLHALKVLEEDSLFASRNLDAQLLQSLLLLEVGRTEEAFNLLQRIEGMSNQMGETGWRIPSALVGLANAQYDRAIMLWEKEAEGLERKRLSGLLQGLPLTPQSPTFALASTDLWAVQQSTTAVAAMYQLPIQASDALFQQALCHLELGDSKPARDLLKEILDDYPEAPIRPLVRFYLFEITGELVDLQPPADWIPISANTFLPDEE